MGSPIAIESSPNSLPRAAIATNISPKNSRVYEVGIKAIQAIGFIFVAIAAGSVASYGFLYGCGVVTVAVGVNFLIPYIAKTCFLNLSSSLTPLKKAQMVAETPTWLEIFNYSTGLGLGGALVYSGFLSLTNPHRSILKGISDFIPGVISMISMPFGIFEALKNNSTDLLNRLTKLHALLQNSEANGSLPPQKFNSFIFDIYLDPKPNDKLIEMIQENHLKNPDFKNEDYFQFLSPIADSNFGINFICKFIEYCSTKFISTHLNESDLNEKLNRIEIDITEADNNKEKLCSLELFLYYLNYHLQQVDDSCKLKKYQDKIEKLLDMIPDLSDEDE